MAPPMLTFVPATHVSPPASLLGRTDGDIPVRLGCHQPRHLEYPRLFVSEAPNDFTHLHIHPRVQPHRRARQLSIRTHA
jgi:hypothetical protein